MSDVRLVPAGRTTAILRDLVAIESVNPYFPGGQRGEGAMADYLADFFARLGLAPERTEVLPGRPNVWARLDAPGARRTLLFEAHMDTVTLEPLGPKMLEPAIANGRLSGRGSCDTKASLAGMLAALEALAARRARPRVNLVILGSVDEEYLMRGILHFARHGPPVDAAVVGEPTRLQVVRAHKGLVRWEITTAGRSAHTSVPEHGDNAIDQMVEVIQALRNDLAPRLATRTHPLLTPPTVTVSTISGGTSVNIVPGRCMIHVDRRTLPAEGPDEVIAEMAATLAALGKRRPDVKVMLGEPFANIAGLDTPADAEIVRVAAEATRVVGGSGEVTGVPYGTNAPGLAEQDVPTIVLGPGDIAQAHTADEFIDLAPLEQAAEIYARIALGYPA